MPSQTRTGKVQSKGKASKSTIITAEDMLHERGELFGILSHMGFKYVLDSKTLDLSDLYIALEKVKWQVIQYKE